jgi:hypothetical protein
LIKTDGISIFSSILKQASLAFACLVFAGIAAATVPVVGGRWEFVVTSGDLPAQTAAMGPASFSTYLLQDLGSPVLTNISEFTTDTLLCDNQSNNNVTVASSSLSDPGNVMVDFEVGVYGGTPFHYVFTGVLVLGPPKLITGTYQRAADTCNQGHLGTGIPDGTFTATWFPDAAGTWAGMFDADVTGTGPTAVAASFTLTTNSDKTLNGTIEITGAGLVDSYGTACIATSIVTGKRTITLQSNMTEGISQQSGVGLELFGTDTAGTRVWINAFASNTDGSPAAVGEDNPLVVPGGTDHVGTNSAYTAFYGISGGPCDGFGGGDAPFLLVTKHKKLPKGHDGQRGRDGQHGHSNLSRASTVR